MLAKLPATFVCEATRIRVHPSDSVRMDVRTLPVHPRLPLISDGMQRLRPCPPRCAQVQHVHAVSRIVDVTCFISSLREGAADAWRVGV
jgi:hypothetical protein